MRIVIFGLALSSSWGNGHATTYRSLLKGLGHCGHEVTFFERDVPWYAQNRDADRFDYCKLHLYPDLDALTSWRAHIAGADAVIVGSYVPEGAVLIDWLMDVVAGRLSFYDIDTPVTIESLGRGDCEYLRKDQIPRFDRYFSFAGGGVLDRLRELGARRPMPLYCSVDTELYRPLPDAAEVKPRWRLGYMGTFAEDRQHAVEVLLLEVARGCPDERFVVAGPGYPDTQRWPPNVDWLTHVGPRDHLAFYADQAFTLNATRSAMVALGCSPSVRLFEAAACGCCIISDAWTGLSEVLEPDHEVVVARSTTDVRAIIEDTSVEQRAAIGRAARARVERDHSHLRRAEYLTHCLLEDTEARARVAT